MSNVQSNFRVTVELVIQMRGQILRTIQCNVLSAEGAFIRQTLTCLPNRDSCIKSYNWVRNILQLCSSAQPAGLLQVSTRALDRGRKAFLPSQGRQMGENDQASSPSLHNSTSCQFLAHNIFYLRGFYLYQIR